MNAPSRTLLVAEFLFLVFWVWLFMWLVRPLRLVWLDALNAAGILGFVLATHLLRAESPERCGLGLATFRPAMKSLAAPTLVGIGAIAAAGLALDALEDSRLWSKILSRSITYPGWAFAQQLLVQGYAHVRLREIFGRPGPAILATGLLFGIFHWPNMMLVGLCIPGGLLWAWSFSKAPNLYALAISHGLLGTAVSKFLYGAYWAGKIVGPGPLLD